MEKDKQLKIIFNFISGFNFHLWFKVKLKEKKFMQQENLQGQQVSPVQNPQTTNLFKIISILVVSIILLVGVFSAGIMLGGNRAKVVKESKTSLTTAAPTSSPIYTPTTPISGTTPAESMVTTWRKATNLSAITFEYPNGWHVSSGWFNKEGDPVPILLDPEPLYGAPRGGPISIIMISDYSGLNSPTDTLNKNLSDAKKNITDLKESTFTANGTTFYKLEGKVNLYNEMVPILEYHALLKGPSTNNINTHIIRAQFTYFQDNEEHQEYAKILDKIVRSLRHRDQK